MKKQNVLRVFNFPSDYYHCFSVINSFEMSFHIVFKCYNRI